MIATLNIESVKTFWSIVEASLTHLPLRFEGMQSSQDLVALLATHKSLWLRCEMNRLLEKDDLMTLCATLAATIK